MISTYLHIGAIFGVAVILVGIIWPLAYFCELWANDFVNDLKPEPGARPEDKTKKHFRFLPRRNGGLVDRLAGAAYVAAGCFLLWPLVLLCAIGYGVLHFLRLSSRFQRHVVDRNVHIEKKDA